MKITPLRLALLLITLLLMLALPAWWGGASILAQLSQVTPAFIALFILLTLVRWFSLSWRWQRLLAVGGFRVSQAKLLPIQLAGDFISENTPTSAGTLASYLFFLKREAVPLAATTAYCNLSFILDLAAGLLLLSLCTILAFLSDSNSPALLAGIGLCVSLLGLGCYLLLIRKFDVTLHWIDRPLVKRLLRERHRRLLRIGLLRLKKRLAQTATLPTTELLLLFGLTLVNWSIRFSLLFLALLAVGGNANLATTAIIQFIAGLVGMLTFLPGGFPGTDLSIVGLLHHSQPMSVILSALLLWRLVTYHVNLVFGGASLVWLLSRRRQIGMREKLIP